MKKKTLIVTLAAPVLVVGAISYAYWYTHRPAPIGPVSQECHQTFPTIKTNNVGCTDSNSCVSGADLTTTHGCQESSDGVCPVSLGTYVAAQKLIATFNNLADGKCGLKVSSALQIKQGTNPKTGKPYSPSSSSCHHVNTAKSGTCIDFNVNPESDYCFSIFYQAARDSGVVTGFLNEYKPKCYAKTMSGGNIHTEFMKDPPVDNEQKISVLSPQKIICKFERSDLWSPQMPWDGSYICGGSLTFDFHGLTFPEGRTFMLKIDPQPENSDFSSYDAEANVPINQITFDYSQVGGDYFQKNQPPCPVTKLAGTLTIFEAVPDIENPFPSQEFNIDTPVYCE